MTSFFSQAQERLVAFGKEISNEYVNPYTGKIQCLSYQYSEYLRETIPGNSEIKEENEILLNQVQGTLNDEEVLVIPVVVHVIHSGQPEGVSRNISEARVLSQIKVLNEDFRRKEGTSGYGSNPLGTDTKIEFCLATIDPDGNPTNGINRVNMGNMLWNMNNAETTLKPQTQWDPMKYFNIWVCEFDPSIDLLGYAQFPTNSGLGGIPFTGNHNTDGVIIDWRAFGRAIEAPGSYFSGYNRGRTTTHEVGHWLGLRHIWGDNSSCVVNAIDTQQDFCPDTPAAAQPNYYCPPGLDSCPNDPGNDMTENYMDYGSDTCLNTFTPNQKARMRAALQNGLRRASLLTSNVCEQTSSTDKFGLGMLSVYPNPTNDVLNLVIPDNYELSGTVTIYNTVGQTVYTSSVAHTNTYSINVSSFESGVYFVKFTKENQSKTVQFIKK